MGRLKPLRRNSLLAGRARRGVCLVAAALAVGSFGAAGIGQQARPLVPGIVPDAGAGAGAAGTKTPPLVYVDDELGEYLSRATGLIRDERYDQAIQILQALIQRDDSGFFAEGKGRFVSLRLKANELLGTMGPKGLKLYRALYDPQAQRLYQEAVASPRPARRLRRLSERYLHTTYGPRALETLGAMYFDRARFSQAAACWQRLLGATTEKSARAVLLAKVAAAHHLAGEAGPAKRAADELKRDHKGARAVLGGTEQALAAFVDGIAAMPVPAERRAGPDRDGWGGLGSAPDGLATMGACDVVLAPRWRRPAGELSGSKDLVSKLLSGGAMHLASPSMPSPFSSIRSPQAQRGQVRLERGHLFLRRQASARGVGDMMLPALVQPVVDGDLVIVRTEECVVAYDLLTGKERWNTKAVGKTNMIRRPPSFSGRSGVIYSAGYNYIGDAGRYALTIGGGRVYTVCDFLPSSNSRYHALRNNPNATGLDRGSRLAAIDLSRQGYLEWVVGREPEKPGVPDAVRNGQFLSAPTYRDGRLYVVVQHLQSYHLACLDAESRGATVWVTPVAQEPAPQTRYAYRYGADPRLSVGSPPAVSDGRVFVTTNAGVVAAFEEETGEPLWGYQYDSRMNTPTTVARFSPYSQPTAVYRPANPVIVSGRRVICLPADSENVVALDAATGKELWSASRRGQYELSAIDADRVLLSGKGLYVLAAGDGKELYGAGADVGVWGRPAVTPKQVLAGALGGVKVLDLATYKLKTLGLASAEGFLGNLVSADGKLISASMLGVCTYFSYDVAREQLTARIDKAAADEKPALLLQRGELAFDARRFEKALADLNACRAAAEAAGQTAVLARLGTRFYLAHVALGNHARDEEEMRAQFLRAASYAKTRQEKAHMTLRLAKRHERVGEYAAAAKLAQQLADQYGQEELVDVEIGPAADEARFGPERSTVRGDRLARDYIQKLIQAYGRECYAEFDRQAGEALEAARASGEPVQILAVATRWPNSKWADDALFVAAERYYLRAAAEPDQSDNFLGEARRHLYQVARMDDSPLRFSAGVALATIYARGGWVTSARKECDGLRELPADMEVAFADVRGRLGDILKQIEAGRLGKTPRRMRLVSAIAPPLRTLFQVAGADAFVLRDQEFRPIRLDEKLAVVKGADAMLLDTTADDAAEAVSSWKGLAGIDKADLAKYSYPTPGMRLIGALSADGKVLAVADRKTMTGLDLVSAKVVWRQEMSKIGIGSFYCMGSGSGVLVVADRTGGIVCVDAATGDVRWKSKLVGGTSRAPSGPPRIAGDAVVLRHNGGRTVTCFHLGRGGRIVGKWTASRLAQCELAADGLIVLLRDGELTVRELAKIDKPLWTRQFDAEPYPAVLGLSAQHIAFSPSGTAGTVEVLSLAGGGQTVASLTTAPVAGAPSIPFDAAFRGDELFVLCSPAVSGRRKSAYGRLTSVRGVNLQKFDVAGRKALWSRDVEMQGTLYYSAVLPIAVGRNHVVVTARHTHAGLAYYTYVIDGKTGQVVQKINLLGKGGAAQTESRRRQTIGPPVITNGRLTVEGSEGVTVYGAK